MSHIENALKARRDGDAAQREYFRLMDATRRGDTAAADQVVECGRLVAECRRIEAHYRKLALELAFSPGQGNTTWVAPIRNEWGSRASRTGSDTKIVRQPAKY